MRKEREIALKNDFRYVQKNYGKINLCIYCSRYKYCPVNIYNAIAPYMKCYKIEKVSNHARKLNIILVYDCDKFDYDWR